MVSLVLRVILVQKERGARLVYQDPGERMAQRGQRVVLDPLVNLDHLVLLERRENLVFLDFLDIPEGSDQRDHLGFQGSLDQTARRELGASLAKLDQEDKEDQRDREAREARGEQLESLEQRELQAVMALLVLLVRGDCLDLKEPMVSLDQKDLLGLLGKMDFLDILDREEKLVSKGRWVHLVPLGLLDLRVHLERLAPWESGDIPDPQGPLESRVFLAPLEKKEPKEIQVLLEVLGKMGPLD